MSYIIAEIGFNHEGDMDRACEMIRAAARAGAHAVKFQTFRASDIALPSSPHFDAVKCGEMDLDQHRMLSETARGEGIAFISTPFSTWAVELLEKIDVPAYKIASMDCTNRDLLGCVARTGKPLYLSTGMATLHEIAETLDFLREEKSGPVTVLHCLSLYPADPDSLNLDIIPFIREMFDVPVGYSDHYPGIDACLCAAMLGAEVIETHFTLDSSIETGDHSHSADPAGLETLISQIALFKRMKGERSRIFRRPDRVFAASYRRGVHAARDLVKGESLQADDLFVCRPASELTPNDLEWLMGKPIGEDIPRYAAVEKHSISGKIPA